MPLAPLAVHKSQGTLQPYNQAADCRLTCSVSFTEKYILFIVTFKEKPQHHTNSNSFSYKLWHSAVSDSLFSRSCEALKHSPRANTLPVQFPQWLCCPSIPGSQHPAAGPLQASAMHLPQCHLHWEWLRVHFFPQLCIFFSFFSPPQAAITNTRHLWHLPLCLIAHRSLIRHTTHILLTIIVLTSHLLF